MSGRRSLVAGSLLAAAVACSGALGCKSEDVPDFSKNPLDVARELTRLKKEADYWLQEFQSSSGQDLGALEKYEAAHRQTTKIAPTTCPLCYVNHGVALTRLGLYYETLIDLLRKEDVGATRTRSAEIALKIAEHTRKAKEYYGESNRQFEVYFRSGEFIDPWQYEWVFRQCAAIGEYDRALYFLDRYVTSVTLTETDKETVDRLRSHYKRQQQLAQESAFEEELRDELQIRDPFGIGGDFEPGN